ncbi:HBL/NHE enterotoxin family protein [Argonema antarcticum]|uniref:HBL/NHE enterotoxin family protein n=1 Tax=Argonema antarcticum TaxID=2942763 RepID=UPI002011EF13|nr:HBL/NHE enterotoxin family protein [Argonema antarcticum]MCL1470661.1 alpha-helical pore-forming toxin family protein [Argonema antarcticum A004/B2]
MTVPRTNNPSKLAYNPLVPRYIKEDISKTVSALVLIKTYATRILQQSEISLNISDRHAIIDNLYFSQRLFKKHAEYIIVFLTPSITWGISNINDYGKIFQSVQLASLDIIPEIARKNEPPYQIIALLNQLEKEARTRQKTAQTIYNILTEFNAELKMDLDNFNSELEGCDQKINSLLKEISNIPDCSKNTKQQIQQILRKHYPKNTDIYANIALINAVAYHFESLFETTNYMVEAHKALSIEWSSIVAGIRSFKQEIIHASNMSNLDHIEENLKLASREWYTINQRAQEMLLRIVYLKPEEVNNVLNWSTPYPLISCPVDLHS